MRTWTLLAMVVSLGSSLGEARANQVSFDFDSAPPHASLPLNLTSGGLTAHFASSSTFYNYSIQRPSDALAGYTPVGFSGYAITPSTISASDLLISFGGSLSDISLMYAPEEYATDSSCTMRITAYAKSSYVGTSTFSIDPPGTWPTGTLSFSSTQPFDNVVIHYDKPPATGGDYGPIFMVDNLLVTPVPVPGDVDANGRVDIFDVAVLQTNYGMTSGAAWAQGDFDGNGTVDIFDVALMQVNYGYGVALSPAPVPEPATLVLLAVGAGGLAVARRRRNAA